MAQKEIEPRAHSNPPSDGRGKLQSEIDYLNRELRAFVALALRHGLRDYCETRHPKLTAELDRTDAHSQFRAQQKYDKVLARIRDVPGLCGSPGDTGERTYYRDDQDNVAYIEHALNNRRFILGGIWVAPQYRSQGCAHKILRALIQAADDADLGIELYYEPFGEEGLQMDDLEAFYNRHGFARHETAPGGLVRLPRSPLDLYIRG